MTDGEIKTQIEENIMNAIDKKISLMLRIREPFETIDPILRINATDYQRGVLDGRQEALLSIKSMLIDILDEVKV